MVLNKKEVYTRRMQALLLALFIASSVLILHAISLEHSLYWTHPFMDVVMHTLGGFALGLLVSVICTSIKRGVVLTGSIVLILIIGWEAFEAMFVIVDMSDSNYMAETLGDVVLGMLSACGAMVLYKKGYPAE